MFFSLFYHREAPKGLDTINNDSGYKIYKRLTKIDKYKLGPSLLQKTMTMSSPDLDAKLYVNNGSFHVLMSGYT